MRLIDADKLKEKLDYLNYELYNSHPVGELSKEEKDTVSWFIQHISKMVDNMPEVKAIPTEWLYKWRMKNNEQYNVGVSSFSQMINDWEKENE